MSAAGDLRHIGHDPRQQCNQWSVIPNFKKYENNPMYSLGYCNVVFFMAS